jgi:YbgC/YbaW family acyl-CoA thioester hydrolase
MPTAFHTTVRVEFHDTDMAGMVHFSNFFRYMEEAEVAFLRSLGLHVSWRDGPTRFGFPRVSASCDFMKPVRFEDVLEVTVTVEQLGNKSVTYAHEFRRGEDLIARGKVTAVYIRVGPDQQLEAQEIPPDIREKLQQACG